MMKRMLMVMCVLSLVTMAQAVMVDDFESYTPGEVVAPWTQEAAGVATIGSDAGNQYITYGDNSGDWRHTYRPTGVNITTTGILSVDVYVEAETGLDHAFGLTEVDAPDWYSNYGPYVRVTDDTAAATGVVSLDVRNGGGFIDDIATLNVGQWYNVQLIIDTASGGVFDVYVDNVLASSGNAFRNAYTTNALDTVLLMSGTQTGDQNVRLDNIQVVPEPATMSLLGFGVLALLRKKR